MPNINHLMHITADRAAVYEAIATIQGVRSWWTIETYGDYEIGGTVNFNFTDDYQNKFRISQLVPNEKVVWECLTGSDEWVGTTVSFHLDDHDRKTRIRFAHEGYKDATDFMAQCSYTWARYLMSLRDYLEKGEGSPFKGVFA